MKLKTDFVTNSSCASFVIQKKHLTDLQIFMIHNHMKIAEQYYGGRNEDPNANWSWSKYDAWKITETENNIAGETSMDNFDMIKFLINMGIDEDHIHHEGCY